MLLVEPTSVHAAVPGSMQLELLAEPSATNCSAKGVIVDSVRKRLGYNPFGAKKGPQFRISVQVDDRGYKASVEQRSIAGSLIGERHIHSESERCSDLFDALALSLALAVGPETPRQWGPRPRPPEGPVRAPRSSLWTPFFFQAGDLVERSLPAERRWNAGLFMTLGRGASPGVAAHGGLSFQWYYLSVEIDADVHFPMPNDVPHQGGHTTVTITQLHLTPALCFRTMDLGLCLRAEAGLLVAQGAPLEKTSTGFAPTLASGVGLEWRLVDVKGDYVSLRGHVSLPILRTRLLAGQRELWTTPLVMGGLGIAAGSRF